MKNIFKVIKRRINPNNSEAYYGAGIYAKIGGKPPKTKEEKKEEERKFKRKINEYKSKVDLWKKEGYDASELVGMFQMKDASLMEQKLREYEGKVQKLKQLERELNLLDTKGFENEVRSIKSKRKDPNRVNQVEREISALKQKIEAKERKRKEAVKVIDRAKSAIQKAKGFNLAVSDAERLLNEAKSLLGKGHKALLGKGDYATAIERANKSKGIAEAETDKKFKHLHEEALNAIGNAQSTLQKAKKLGINTKSVEEKLNNAKRRLDEKDFSNATKLANQCKNSLDEKINEYREAAKRSAKQSLDFAYSKMKEAERLGINVSSAQDLHRKAISKFDRRKYEKAIEYSENCKKAAEEEISRYNHAKEQIKSSKDIVENVKRVVSIPKAEILMKNAEAALEIGNYNSAFKFTKQAEGEALKFKQDYERYKETSEFISSIESEISRIKSSGVKIPKSAELIKQAKSELNKNNFERAKEFAEEAKKIASERKSGYNLAFKSISESERILKETKNKGVIISSDLLTKSKQAFDNGDYEGSVRLSEELKNLVNNTEIKYREARDWIKSAESSIERAKEFGCDVLDAEERLKNTEKLFEDGAYEEVIKVSKQVVEQVKKIRGEAKPEIAIELSRTSFEPNAWKRIDLTIKNKGGATAKAINVEYPKERVEIEDLKEVEGLKPTEEKKLRIGFRPIQVGEVPLKTKISYMDLDNKEYNEEKTFWITVGEEKPHPPEGLKLDIKRETEFFNGFIRLKMAVTNPMSQIITDVSLELDLDEHTLRLDRHEPEYPVKKGKVQLGTISPDTGKTVAFYLDPMTCTKAGTDINCRVDYRDAYGKSDSIRMESKKVEVVCPIFSTESDINIGMLKEFIETLPYHDNKIYQIPPGLETDKLIETCRETIQMHDVRHIRTLRTKDDKTCETWYYGKTKVAESNIVIKASINEETESIEFFAATPSPESLTGLLAELGHNLTKNIKEIGKKPAQIVNVSIKDTIIQRSPNLLNFCDMEGVCSEENIIVEDSVIQRSRIGGV